MTRLPVIAAGLLMAISAAAAQTPDTPGAPVMGSSAASGDATAPADEKHITQVLVLGDAIGGGLGAGLTRITEPGVDYEVSLRFNEESGVARPEVYDWAATVPKILASNSYDVIVVMLGANDRQTIRDGDTRYVFGSDGWDAAYGKQMDRLLDQLAQSGARVIWVSPPPMKDSEYDAAVRKIAGLQRQRVEARGMTFLDIRPPLSAPDGTYTDIANDDTGNIIKLRARDGISFFKAGNNLMGQLVLDAIQTAKSAVPDKTALVNGKTDRQVPEAPAKQSQVPLFGQAVMDAEPYTIQPDGVTANAMLLAAGGMGSESALKTLRDIAPKGSGAELLFKLGQPEPAPLGRPDDFTAPPVK